MKKRNVVIIVGSAVAVIGLAAIVSLVFTNDTDVPKQSKSGDALIKQLDKIKDSDNKPVATDKININFAVASPGRITVKAGTNITWTNNDLPEYTISKIGDEDGPASGPIKQGQSYSYTYTKPGEYTYSVSSKPVAKGVIIVTP